jgi:DNA-binding transcriptional LysR family regulator
MATYSLLEAEPESAGQRDRIELRHLHYFLGLAEELHFGRAAARLYITQPGLSQAVARLERRLEVKLFDRTQRDVRLTEAGTELVQGARRLLAHCDEVVTRVRSVGRGELGVVRLGLAPMVEPILAPALSAFHDEHARIALDRSVMLSERLLEQLQRGSLDTAIVHQVPALAAAVGIEWEPLRRGRLAVVASARSPVARHEIVTLADLHNQTFLMNPRSVAPAALEGLKLMCREYGGFDAKVRESTAAAGALGTDWRQVDEQDVVVLVPEPAAPSPKTHNVAVVAVQPPPEYVVAIAWRRGEEAVAVLRLIGHLRSYRDEQLWVEGRSEDSSLAPTRWDLTANHQWLRNNDLTADRLGPPL